MMESHAKNGLLSETIRKRLRCPVCKSKLTKGKDVLRCTKRSCRALFPVVDGVPVLINERASLFSLRDFTRPRVSPAKAPGKPSLKSTIEKLLPVISENVAAKKNLARFCQLLLASTRLPKVLVVGSGELGKGMENLSDHTEFETVLTDIRFGPRNALICDAHDLPFEAGTFDGLVIQAVLEHVVDPFRCVDEIHRVLKPKGIVYAETPFIQQVHAGRYDFTRFTHLGHRRLFRSFEEIESGAACGPGMALAWSYHYFLLSLIQQRFLRKFVEPFVRLTSFFLKYVDRVIIRTPSALDSASAYYFLGRRSDAMLSDRDLIELYRGAEGGELLDEFFRSTEGKKPPDAAMR